MALSAQAEGTVVTIDGAEDEVTIVFRNTLVVAVLSHTADIETDTVEIMTNVVSKRSREPEMIS